jgi:hypothetical protein
MDEGKRKPLESLTTTCQHGGFGPTLAGFVARRFPPPPLGTEAPASLCQAQRVYSGFPVQCHAFPEQSGRRNALRQIDLQSGARPPAGC